MSASTTAPGRQVVLRGGSPWGFRMHGGADTTQPLRISRVNPGSKAFDESVREGEVITSINGQPTIGLPNCEAHALIKAAGDTLQLTLSQDPSKRRPHKPAATPPQPEHNTEKQTSETGEIKESKEYASEISLATQKTTSTNKTKSQPPASHESPKSSSSSHRVGGRQKRSRRLRARKLALQLDSLLHTPDAGLLPEPDWQQVDEQIAPLPPAVHAYPLVYAEAIVASDAASEQLVRLFQVHVATKQAKMQAKQRIKAETFPPSLRRLDVIREDEEAAQSIYEDVDIRGTQESLLSSDGEMVASDADEATLEFEKIMNLEEQNYEAYHSSSSDVDGDFGRCRSEDYEPVLVREGRLLVQQIRVQQCPGEEFEQICDAEELLDGRNIEAEFEEVCRQNSELIESPEPDNKENIEPRTKKSEVVLEIAKLNFLKTPFEDEIVTKTEIITLDSPRSSGKIPRALAAQLEENLEMLEREIEAENEQLRDVAARSAEIVDKFSAKLDEMNELINVSGSPVIMEQINEFAEQLIAAEDKSLFETNKDKLVSFIREASGMEAVHRPAKVQDESNLLRFLEQEPRTGDQEEQTLTSLEEVTRRLAQVLQNSLQNSPSPPPPAEANFDSSDNEAGKSGLSRTPVSLQARSRSASFDSNASQGTTIYVGSPCSSACSSGWTAGGGVVPSLRTLCVSAVGRLARGRELMLAWGLASAADLKISRPNLARRPVPPPPAPRWFPTGLGAIAVGLSPAQQRAEPQLTRERAALLLDLHCKFAQRRAYHEQRPLPAAPAPSADAMGVDEASPDAEKMLQDWLQDELSIDESHTQSVMTTARKFEVDRYHISKQRDIAVEIQGQRQFRMLRQQMEQLEEERRQQEQLLDDEQQQMAPPVGADSPIAEQDPLQRLAQLESDATAAPTSMAAQEQAADGHGPGNNNNATSTPAGKMPSTVPSPSFKAKAPSPGVWSPKTSRAHPPPSLPSPTSSNNDEPPPPPVWTPKASPTLERKEFRPVRFEASTPPPRPPPCTQEVPPPFDPVATATISNFLDRKLTLDIPKLPRAQNPTVTLLQRAREGQLPKGATYLERTTMSASDQTQQQKETQAQQESASNFNPNDILYTVKREEEKEANKKVVQLAPIVYDGIGPTTKDGIPIVMRSNIKEENYGKWYKRMYDSLHKAGKDGHGGYASEPEPSGEYDSDVAGGISSKYATLDRRRIKNKEADFTSTTMPRSRGMAPSIKYACEVYKNQPGRIEDYEPGRSSISEKEAKLWWDEVMDIFDGQSGMQASAQSKKLHASSFSDLQELEMITVRHAAESQSTAKKQHMANALKDVSASDTQLVFKKRTESEALSPVEQKQVYKTIQSGGEVPLSGLRKLAPEKPKDGIEYFPVSPTLTRIRVHKPSFCSFKRTARLAAPMPPLRRSSRHNPSLRLWSTLPAPPTRIGLLRERLLAAKPSRIPIGTTTRSTTVLLGRREPVRLSVTVSPRGRQLLNTNETAPVRRVSASAARHADCVAKKKVALKAAPAPSSLAKPKSKEEPPKKPAPRRKMGVASKKQQSFKPNKEEARVLEKARKFSHLSRTARPSAESSAQIFLTQRRAVSQSPFRVYDALFHCSAPCLAPRQQRSRSAPPAVLEPGNRRPLTPLTPQARADYVEYLLELRHKLPPGRRFKELAHLFSSLERIANLQKLTASCSDVRKAVAKQPKLANFERWWCERTLYKADKELKLLYDDLRQAQRDSVFAGRVPGALPTWRPDSGLRCKEASVEDLRNKYLSIASAEGTTALQLAKLDELQTQKDNYKPLWRASSVQNLAEQMSSGEKRRSRSVGGVRASSLTGQQVATLKSRLSDILKTPPPTTKFEVCVGADDKAKQQKQSSLHVRRNSLVSREQLYSPAARRREAKRSASMKADSVAALPSATVTAAATVGLSESDKRRISLSLSQEILARVGKKKMKKDQAKSTAEPSREKPSGKKAGVPPPPPPPEQSPAVSPRTCYSLDGSAKKEDDEQFVLVLAPAGDAAAAANKAVEQWAGAGGAGGRASTTSSDASNRTVVSRSCTDLKDFFGERAATPTSMVRARSTSPVVRSLTERFERRRTPSPIAPRKFKDRFVSRVNVISKTASLQKHKAGAAPGAAQQQQRRSRSGDVFKLCQHFENASLLGQMFTSTPDVRELNSVAPLYFSKPCLKTGADSSGSKYNPELHRPKFTYRPVDDPPKQQQQQQQQQRPSSRNVTFREPDALQSFFEEFERDKESPHKFVECGDVTIHYRSPVRGLARDAPLSEEELARRQEEAMRRIYQEERRRKYLQELHDIESRRHTDNFTPSQKSPIPLNRYDNFFEDIPSRRDRTPEPKMVARALYNFVGQSSRELTFRRGDIILVRRQIDRNWYEGEHNASVGLFPFNYVEIIPYDGVRTMPKGPSEGKARAKFNFVAQSSLELSLVKGEMVVLTRRVDDNWYEGRIGVRRGIFPCTYVEVINEPGERLDAQKPKLTAAYMNGSAPLTGQSYSSSKYLPYMSQTLHIDTRSDPIPYRSLYNYKPQNEDELELREGDTVFVMEKCDDGWYVGTSNRTGHFGTFPGNYVERI
ncbi:uncharacterized protein LOC135941455 isoform X6 [Cloeon dipterum]|uniref:uncharacterized protein LOC135941455 isoform X6 n=1 Tax=Cloeon dipterum TaxID=197152 RepID=UPI00321FC457